MHSNDFRVKTDVAIIGAGPAGCSTSLFLAKAGIKHVVFDKALFPRDKICGDGLSGKVVAMLNRIDPSFVLEMSRRDEEFLGSWGVTFISPGGQAIDIPFSRKYSDQEPPPGFIAKRYQFDQFLVDQLDQRYADLRLGEEVLDIERNGDGVVLHINNGNSSYYCQAAMVVGAEGDRSIVAKRLAGHKLHPSHYIAGLRTYYANVTDLHPQNYIELHFIEDLLPGYFWIFPLPEGQANVGIGMLTKDIKNKKINLRHALRNIIEKKPVISRRFRRAQLIDDVKGWGLPLGSLKREISGDRFILTGDAASLIDPFTGEGIGNALTSGQHAAKAVEAALAGNDYSKAFLQQYYDSALYNELWHELRLSFTIQRLVRIRKLFNFVVNRAHKNQAMRDAISNMFTDLDMRSRLRSPMFYLRLLFNI